jgi:hypothetical protein
VVRFFDQIALTSTKKSAQYPLHQLRPAPSRAVLTSNMEFTFNDVGMSPRGETSEVSNVRRFD